MNKSSGSDADNNILIVESDKARAQSFQQLLQFLKYQTYILKPDDLTSKSAEELDAYLAIFAVNEGPVSGYFLSLNNDNQCQFPVVLLAEKDDLDEQKVVVHLPFVSAIHFQPDYYSMNQVLDHVKIHNKRERRMSNRSCDNLIGSSPAIKFINHMIDQVADTNASVLIMGESGTGKEVIARNIHAQSNRSNKPFIPINCGAIPSELLESELFGHEKGAFTGAISARQGRFELAEGGVIFLDEIGDMPLPMQVKLLRVLQERSYERVGSNRTQKTDVRVIAATHRRLEEQIKDGKFREDLYYRLNVFPIDVPPLRERREDIALLIHEMVNRIERENRGSVRLSKAAMSMLSLYDWPGNVRELANLVERLAILYPHGVVDVKDLPQKFVSENADISSAPELPAETEMSEHIAGEVTMNQLPDGGIDMKKYLTEIEISLIEQALTESNNVVARAANLLQMRRTTLVEKMRKYEIVR
ncbi:MAG: sigma-54 dependent transcriptional regulator [Gammaproteobacteria bacterium]|nr:sigma-54 dependent transcriptional regulator [Gammaproteobacteria bacterium]